VIDAHFKAVIETGHLRGVADVDLAVVALAAGAVDVPVELFFVLQISAE
jgi:hypothetical protein